MSKDIITIESFADLFEAELAKNLLEEAGIAAYIEGERFTGMMPSFAGDIHKIRLQVEKDKEGEAKELLEGLEDANLCTRILKEENALMEGHFLLTSGNHSNRYIEKIKVLQSPRAAAALAQALAKRMEQYEFDTVIGPAYGAIVLAYEVAKTLDKSFIFTQRKDGEMIFRSGFDLSKTKKAIVIEDIVSTGGSIKEVLSSAKDKGIEIVACGILVDRSGGKLDLEIPLQSLLTLEVPLWAPDECEMCKEGVPLVRPGSSDKI
ncbi:MAG: orotate phosphoribosyltransferase [Candidatus Cloacimonadaceae bacterium]